LAASSEIMRNASAREERTFGRSLEFATQTNTGNRNFLQAESSANRSFVAGAFDDMVDFLDLETARGDKQVQDTLTTASDLVQDLTTSEQAKLTEKIALGAFALLGIMFLAPVLKGAA